MSNLTEHPVPGLGEPAPQPAPSRVSSGSPPGGQRWLGGAILVLTVFLLALEAVAITLASSGDPVAATTLAWALIVLMICTVIGGFVAIILNRGRRLAIVAVALGVLGNPLVATWLLTALDAHNS